MVKRERLPIIWPNDDGTIPQPVARGSDLERTSLVEKAVEGVSGAVSDVGSKVVDSVKIGLREAASTVGTYVGVVPSALLIKVTERGFFDVDDPGFDLNGLSRVGEVIDLAHEQEERLIKVLYNQGVAVSLARQILINDAAWASKVDRETDITPREDYLAKQAVEQMLDGASQSEVEKGMENEIYVGRVRSAVEAVAASVVLFQQAKVLEKMGQQASNETIVFDVPPLPLLLGSILTGRGVAATVQSAMIPHQGKKRGVQITLVGRGAEGYSVVVRRGGKKGGMDEYTSRAQIEWKETGSYMALTDSKFGAWLRRKLGVGEVEVGCLEIANPGREDSMVIPMAVRGEGLKGQKMGPAGLVRDNMALVQDILDKSSDLVNRSRQQIVSELELMRDTGTLEGMDVRQVLEKLLAQADEDVDSTVRVSVVMWRAKKIYDDIMKKRGYLRRVRGQTDINIDDIANEILASIGFEDDISANRDESLEKDGEVSVGKQSVFAKARERRKKVKEQIREGERIIEEENRRKEAANLLDQAGSIMEQYASRREEVEDTLRQDLAKAVETLGVEEAVARLIGSGIDRSRVVGILMLTGMSVSEARKHV